MVKKITIDKHIEIVKKGISKNTLRGHSTYFNSVSDYFKGRYYDDVYLDELKNLVNITGENSIRRAITKNGAGAQESIIYALRRIWTSAVTDGLTNRNIALELKRPPKSRARNRRGLNEKELKLLQKCLATKTKDPELSLLVLRLALETGARRGELLAIKFGDIQRESGCINLLTDTKKNSIALQPITKSLMQALDLFIKNRIGNHPSKNDFILVDKLGNKIGRRWFELTSELVRNNVKELSGSSEVWFSWHLTRHTMATLIERSSGYSIAARYLRHNLSNLSTVTGIYTSVTLDELKYALSLLWKEDMS